jgi:CDP-glucose 4,6-dehydratase
VLVTGHTGFKGAWLTAVLASVGADVTGIALAPAAGGIYERAGLGASVDSHIVDIRDEQALRKAVLDAQPEVIFHLAAQALVPAGYADPVTTFDTNVTGTAHLLHAACASASVQQVLVVTSDKVYANDGTGRAFKEDDRLGGGDPYSASKAACELVVQCWRHLLAEREVALVSARAGNVIGGGDVAEGRLLPDVFRALDADGCVQLRHPTSVRPWQFVLEPVFGYIRFVEHLAANPDATPAALNFGPEPDGLRTVQEVVGRVFEIMDEGMWEPATSLPGPEARTLSLDPGLARSTLGWKSVLDLDTALSWTCDWYRTARDGGDCGALCAEQIARYQAFVPA